MATTPARRKLGIGFVISSAVFALAAGVMFTTEATPPWFDTVVGIVDAISIFLAVKFTKPVTE